MSEILIVDDEPAIGWSLRELLTDEGHAVTLATTVADAIAACRRRPPDTILLDVRLPGRDGISAIPELRALAPSAPVIVMTAFGDLDTAVRTVAAGAFDYLIKPFDLEQVTAVVARALADRGHAAAAVAPSEEAAAPQLIGSGPRMQAIFKHIALVANTDLPVLVSGAAGTGKELVARTIHAHGGRRAGPFVATSLAALAPGAVEGELFGHTRPGLFELAAGGTLFLDEIGATPLDVQAKLLRTLETAAFTRLGSAAPTAADVRVIAATDQDLAAAVGAGTFRADLYERLRVLSIDVPPLAARPEDIEPLARHFLARHSGRQPQPAARPAIATECFQALRDHPWPGNVRELKHAIEYAAVIARGGTLRPEHLPAPTAAATGTTAAPLAAATAALTAATKEWAAAARHEFGELAEPDLHHRASTAVEAALLREVLAHTGGNRTAAAKLLGLDRATLRTKLRHLGLDD
ncbi:MAG: sigma-54 dependent transcriptional regulator [Planctomycetaceae bacterium]|nr:sigma-54 dependent transcriptional regulator [Planctomycetaceae bacterium]